MKFIPYNDILEEALKDPEFKREYDKLEPWYQREVARMERLNALDDAKRHKAETKSREPKRARTSPAPQKQPHS